MNDLLEILDAERGKPRGDEASAHVADLWACDRQTWYRRHGVEKPPFTREKLAQFAIGHGYEREVARTLREAGYAVATDFEVEVFGLVGHPDILWAHDGRNAVIEVKTTELQTPKPEVSRHYAMQAAAYALGMLATDAFVLVKHARTHIEKVYPVDFEALRPTIEMRAEEVHRKTGASAVIPAADPGEYAAWGCRWCSYTLCESNPDHVIPE